MRVACLAMLLALFPLRASAQSTAENSPSTGAVVEPSESLELSLRAALETYESGDLARAGTLMAEVHAQQPSARTLRGLGIVAYRQARYPEAVNLLELSLVHPIKPLTDAMQAGVRELLQDAGQRVGQLELAITPKEAEILVDGVATIRDSQGRLILMPGAYELDVFAPGYASVRVGISASAGVTQSMRVVMRELRPALPFASKAVRQPDLTISPLSQTPSSSTPELARTSSGPERLERASYVMLALSAVALVTAGAVGLRARSKIDGIEDRCRERPDELCEPGETAREEREANIPLLEKLATASLIVAAGTGIAGGALYVSAWRSKQEPRERAFLLGFSRNF